VSTCCSNPAGGEQAWCGNSPEWIRSVVDLSDWVGQDVQFRFRLITDSSVAEPGWYIDDLAVQSCVASPQIFEDRFEQ
jgi:bacillopeptidase F (M6 metalloprotease family)